MNANFNRTDSDPNPRFRGYRIVDGRPEFLYQIGTYSVRERISPVDPRSFRREYSIETNDTSPIRLEFDAAIRPSLQASHGNWEGDALILSSDEASQFNLVQQF